LSYLHDSVEFSFVTKRIDTATLRRVSVDASCDPRTVSAVLEGRSTRGLAFERAKAALLAAGFRVPNLRVVNGGK